MGLDGALRFPTRDPEIHRVRRSKAQTCIGDVELDTRVERLEYEADSPRWIVSTSREQLEAQFVVMATGVLSIPLEPSIPGLELFSGPVYRTSRWPHDHVDFCGKKVGLIGTGSSGIQCTRARHRSRASDGFPANTQLQHSCT